MANQVVARYHGGAIVKGTSLNVDPNKPTCHVRTAEGTTAEVRFADLKALFFVKSLTGDPLHNEGMDPASTDPRGRGAQLVELRFKDGERMVGFANRFPPVSKFFYVVPVDTKSNNIRILVNLSQLRSVSRLQAVA